MRKAYLRVIRLETHVKSLPRYLHLPRSRPIVMMGETHHIRPSAIPPRTQFSAPDILMRVKQKFLLASLVCATHFIHSSSHYLSPWSRLMRLSVDPCFFTHLGHRYIICKLDYQWCLKAFLNSNFHVQNKSNRKRYCICPWAFTKFQKAFVPCVSD
jgi:hypothetical protein